VGSSPDRDPCGRYTAGSLISGCPVASRQKNLARASIHLRRRCAFVLSYRRSATGRHLVSLAPQADAPFVEMFGARTDLEQGSAWPFPPLPPWCENYNYFKILEQPGRPAPMLLFPATAGSALDFRRTGGLAMSRPGFRLATITAKETRGDCSRPVRARRVHRSIIYVHWRMPFTQGRARNRRFRRIWSGDLGSADPTDL